MPSILVLIVTHRGAPTDLEAEQFLLRITGRVVFDKPVLHSRVNAITRDGKGFPIRTYVQHVVVEGVRAVEINRLAQRVRRRIAEARDVAQTRITGKTDGLDTFGNFRVGNAVGKLLRKRKAVVLN